MEEREREMEIYSIRIFEIPIFACLENVLRFAAVQMMLAPRTNGGGGGGGGGGGAAGKRRRQHMDGTEPPRGRQII